MSHSYENVRLLIADSSHMVRTGLKAALHGFGFRSIMDTAAFVKLHDMFAQDAVDLVITSSELENNSIGYLISEMRNRRLGTNPFAVVIVLLTHADPDYVRKIIDSGVDDLLLTPVVPEQLMARIDVLARSRKPFVVTHDYTGPDRRTRQRTFIGQQASMLDVPNPLKARRRDGVDGTRYQRIVDDTAASLNRIKIERYAVQIDWLVNHVHASIRDGVANVAQLVPHITKLAAVSDDMIKRMRGTPAETGIPSVVEVLEAARRMEAAPDTVAFPEMERLHTLSRSIARKVGAPVPVG